MPKVVGLFDSFDNLDQVLAEDVASWIKPVPQIVQIENYLANKILYPQTLPITDYDMKIELAILREALKLNGPKDNDKKGNSLLGDNPFLNITLRKILIPARFLRFVPNLAILTWVFIDALLLNRKKEDWFQDLWTVILTDDTEEIVGTVILPQFNAGGTMEFFLPDKNYKIQSGSLQVIPCISGRCNISYKLNNGKILGKSENVIEVCGGKLGLIIDGRIA